MTGGDDGLAETAEHLLDGPVTAERLRKGLAQAQRDGDRARVEALIRLAERAFPQDAADWALAQRINREMGSPGPEVVDRVFELTRTIAEATAELNRILTETWALEAWDYDNERPLGE
ncbi:hypothetical protein G4X40_22560 [Rhodococcus sp. D2-41]|uniref:hypothetical protein n=1 Tax=Speluncibacter jeojiensis TaxID=2710754 RepID=UPI00240F44DA|nr:hypothetical protein [Rhodococcus sp. D2-41]MDG3012924.1 hypothetical protein [Rhodococcus sp. D2-41]